MSSNYGWIESVTSELHALVGELNFQFFLYLQVTRTCIKFWTSLTFGQIGLLTMELAALECLKISHRLIMGKWYLQASSFIFDRIFVKLAGTIDILWNLQVQLTFQTLEYFVILFSGTVRPRRLKLGTHLGRWQMYHVYWNQAAAAYSSLYFFIFLSLQFSTLKFFVTLFWGTVRPRRLKLDIHVHSGQMYHIYWNQPAAAYSSLYFFIFLSLQFSTLKFFVTLFLETLRPRRQKLVHAWTVGRCIMCTRIRLLLLIHPFISS